MSLRQMQDALTAILTSPWPGVGGATSRTSTVLFPGRNTAFIVWASWGLSGSARRTLRSLDRSHREPTDEGTLQQQEERDDRQERQHARGRDPGIVDPVAA